MNPGIRKEAEKRFTPHFFVHLYQGAASGATQHVHHTDEVRQGQQRRDPHRSWRDGRRRNRISRRQGGVPGCGRRHARRSQQTRSDSGRQEGAHEGARPDHMASLYSGRRSWSTDDRLHRVPEQSGLRQRLLHIPSRSVPSASTARRSSSRSARRRKRSSGQTSPRSGWTRSRPRMVR
jgi:hypothetical protein